MIYFDAAYIVKCYLNEPGAEHVRKLAGQAPGLTSCEFGRIEFFAAVHRHLRERNITVREARDVIGDLEEDEENGVWHWLPLTSIIVHQACERLKALPRRFSLRAGDAVHLECARDQGFRQIYTNDRQMLTCARLFNLEGINILRA